MQKTYAPFIQRRTKLYESLKKKDARKPLLFLFAGFESERTAFRQDSSFYYLTGLEEPATVLLMNEAGTTLFVPQYGTPRAKWAITLVEADAASLAQRGIDRKELLGQACRGYSLTSSCVTAQYEQLLTTLERHVDAGGVLYTVYQPEILCEHTLILDRLFQSKPKLKQAIVDISAALAQLRRTKSQGELESIYEAIDCTMQAHEAAAMRIEPDVYEYQIQAGIEFVFKESGGSAAFPSVVGSGKNSTVLHYGHNNSLMKKGDLVVVDVGAELNYYCADITRTYPVSGTFSDRQREVYTTVLEAQEYIASLAAPGYWLCNNDHPAKSLQHLTVAFLKERGYEKYFPHGIGHFLGLDVHDVGDRSEPLKEGDVITIEPGIYIPQERLGVRIEDNYWITAKGAVCMSDELPRDSYEIEEMMKGELDEE